MTQLVNCPHCRALIEDDSCFCDQCGKQLMRCTECGNYAKSKICTKCGSPTQPAQRTDGLTTPAGGSAQKPSIIAQGLNPQQASATTPQPVSHVTPQSASGFNANATIAGNQRSDNQAQSTQPFVMPAAPANNAGSATVRPDMPIQPQPQIPIVNPGHIECRSGVSLRVGLGDGATIGRRGSYGNIFAQFPSISGNHAKLIQCSDGTWQIMDVGSSYGTFLNGAQLSENVPVKIKVGDILRFANIDFEVVI